MTIFDENVMKVMNVVYILYLTLIMAVRLPT